LKEESTLTEHVKNALCGCKILKQRHELEQRWKTS